MRTILGFRSLWVGDMVARLGYQVALFLLPLLAVTVLHVSATEVGLISAAGFLPVMLLSLSAGVMADRVPARTLLIVCNLVRGAALGVTGLLYALVGLDFWLLIGAAIVIGAMTVFYDVAYQTAVPRVLLVSELVSGNSVLQATNSATQMAGPAIAGFLVESTGVPLATAITSALFGGAVASFWFLRLPVMTGVGAHAHRVSIVMGLRFTWRCRAIRDLCLQSGVFNLHEEAFLIAFLVYAIRVQHLSGGAVGVIIGLSSVGALIGSLTMRRFTRRLSAGTAVTGSLFFAALSLLLGRLLSDVFLPSIVLASAFLANGVALATYNVYAVSLRQAIPPPEYIASVTASYRLVSFGTIPLGALLGGVLTDAVGAAPALLVIGVSMTVSCLMLFASPLRGIRDVVDAKDRLGADTTRVPP